MPNLAKPEAPEPDLPQGGVVVEAPPTAADPFTVRIPAFDDDHVFEVRYWMPRGAAIPSAGDAVLVVFDETGEPWVPAWWPS